MKYCDHSTDDCPMCGPAIKPQVPEALPPVAGSQIAVADLREWISQLREKFGLPAKVKRRDEWWDGYEGAIQDLEAFVSRQSENANCPSVGATE
jgi:hypothetical protein